MAASLSTCAAAAHLAVSLKPSYVAQVHGRFWFMVCDGVEGALLRQDQSDGSRRHWQGERGAERMVRVEFANGNAQHYEGGPGATERLVRKTLQDGTTQSFEGERGAERLVRVTLPDGRSMHFEGARGVERPVRSRV